MAQVRKLQVGGTTTEPYKINTVTPKQYFQVGSNAYDLSKYKDLVWHNFDSWIESEGYDSSIKDKSRKFINEILESLTTNEAHFNPDLTLTAKDNKNNWDPTSGFNKGGPKWLHWLTSDIVDDQRGIPHVTMRYLTQVLSSPVMQNYKKPDQTALADLTGKVFDKVVQRDFGNSWETYAQNWKLRSNNDKIRIFKDALKDFKNSTDFSIYTDQSIQDFGPKIDEFIKYLDTSPELNQQFFDKASSLGFYGLEQWMNYQAPSEQAQESNTEQGTQNTQQSTSNTSSATRVVSLNDINQFVLPDVSNQIKFYNNNNRTSFFRKALNNNINSLVSFRVNNMQQVIQSLYAYDRWSRAKFPNDPIGASNYLSSVSKYINKYLMGQATPFDRDSINAIIELVLNKANIDNSFANLISSEDGPGFQYLQNSYDPETQTYLAINNDPNSQYNGTIFAIPAIFISSNSFWVDAAKKLNDQLKANNKGAGYVQQYTPEQVYNFGILSFYKDKVVQGNLKEFLEKKLNMQDYPKMAKGGIIKAANGVQIYGNDKFVHIRQGNKQQEDKPDQSTQAYIDRQNAQIRSWKDLKDNLDIHDAFAVGTLLSDLVAFGGSLSGGAFNPVTDVATLTSMVGTIGTVSTDKSMNLLQKIGYGALGVGMDALALVPEIGAIGKAAKIAKFAKIAVPILSKAIRFGGMGLAGINALKPLKKLYDGETLTKGDWTHLAYFAEALLMGNVAGRSVRGGNKYTVKTGETKSFQLKTKSGWKNVNENTYKTFVDKKVKDLKPSKEGEPLLKTTDGQELYVSDFSKGKFGNSNVKGRIQENSSGVRLMTPEEVSALTGVPPIKINGKTYYATPINYQRVAGRMNSSFNQALRSKSLFNSKVEVPLVNSRGDVILGSNGNPVMVTVSKAKARQMSELYNSKHGEPKTKQPTVEEPTPKAQPKEEINKAPEDTPKANDSKPKEQQNNDSPGETPNIDAPKVEGAAPKIEPQKTLEPPKEKISKQVMESFKREVANLGRTGTNVKNLKDLLKQSKNKKALPVIQPGHAYYYSPKSQRYIKAQYKDLKTKKELNKKLKANAIKFQFGGLFPFNKISKWDLKNTINGIGGSIDWNRTWKPWQERVNEQLKEIYPNFNSIIYNSQKPNSNSTTYTGQKPGPNEKTKWIYKIPEYINRYTSPHHLLAIGNAALAIQNARKVRDIKNAATIPALEAVNNNIIYQPTFAVQRDFATNRQMGETNTSASKALSGNIRDYFTSLFANNMLNQQAVASNLDSKATEFQTNQKNNLALAKASIDDQIATTNRNNQKVLAAIASKAANEEEYQIRKDQNISNIIGMYQEEEASREKARNILGQYALKDYHDSFSDNARKLNEAHKAYKDAKKKFEVEYRNNLQKPGSTGTFNRAEFEKAWSESVQAKQLQDNIKKYGVASNMGYYQLLMKGTTPGFYTHYQDLMRKKLAELNIEDPSWYKRGGSLSYEQRMSLKQQDAINKMISTDKKERNSVKRELIKEYNKNMRLVSKRSETLLKAAIGIK